MPILIIGALAGALLTHVWHKEVKRQSQQEAHLDDLHEKLSAKFVAAQKKE